MKTDRKIKGWKVATVYRKKRNLIVREGFARATAISGNFSFCGLTSKYHLPFTTGRHTGESEGESELTWGNRVEGRVRGKCTRYKISSPFFGGKGVPLGSAVAFRLQNRGRKKEKKENRAGRG